jgi:hypothetical protein
MTRLITWISRYVLAVTFIFSGFAKGVDPLGFAYKFGDYFTAFGMDFMMPFVLPLSFALCAAELFIGLILLINVRNYIAIWGAFLFMAVFTPLTLILAIFNPVSDCGCFGDAIVLTNWETFFKNIPLFIASILMLYHRKSLPSSFNKLPDYLIAVLMLVVSFIPPFHGYFNLPLIDFRPYSIGTNIPEAMVFPADAPTDQYQTTLYYSKDGVVKEFSQENFPWQDSTWKYVDSKSVLIKKGYKPPISDFTLTDNFGWNKADSILNSEGYFILAVATKLPEINTQAFAKLNELYYKAKQEGIGFVCLTSSAYSDIDRFVSKTGVAFPFLQADEIMLKTTIRANPGIMLLYKGTIIGKWHHNNFPEPSFFEGDLVAKTLTIQRGKLNSTWIYLIIILSVFGSISLHHFAHKQE